MTHPYRTITEHVGSLQSLFNIYPYMDTFKKIWEDEQYKGDFSIPTKIIKYIVFAFSIESEKITPNGDRGAEMRRIFKEMEIDENLYTNVVLLEDPNIREAAAKWLDYQDEPQLLYLWTLQMAYTQQQSASISNLVKNGVIDYDQKQKCVEHMRQLKVWIKDAQQG